MIHVHLDDEFWKQLKEVVREVIREELSDEKEEPLNNFDMNMAVKVTGYSRNTIYKLVNKREIPHYKHRGRLRFDEDKLKEWVQGKVRPIKQNRRFRYD